MIEWTKFDWFCLGLILGYGWYPLWSLGKKIVHEARIAKNEWKKETTPGPVRRDYKRTNNPRDQDAV